MTEQDFDYVCRLVRDRSAIVLEPGKEYLVQARLLPVAKQLNLTSVSALVAKLQSGHDDKLNARVVEAMTTSETLFFRDHHPFETLRTVVLPELIRKRASERRLDIWSAACSSGQEPYSLAILIREHFPRLIDWHVNIVATDLSGEVLARAKEGRYSQLEVNRGMPSSLLVKYFQQQGSTWQLCDAIRNAVTFHEMNLVRPWPPMPRMDLVFLRNVLIYFDIESKKTILGRVARLLRPDGYLLLGGAETTINLDAAYRRAEELKGGFYRLVE